MHKLWRMPFISRNSMAKLQFLEANGVILVLYQVPVGHRSFSTVISSASDNSLRNPSNSGDVRNMQELQSVQHLLESNSSIRNDIYHRQDILCEHYFTCTSNRSKLVFAF
ncbi:hypothetical protein VTO42DRAFT_5094 [Malbranchea cinnamomea]